MNQQNLYQDSGDHRHTCALPTIECTNCLLNVASLRLFGKRSPEELRLAQCALKNKLLKEGVLVVVENQWYEVQK